MSDALWVQHLHSQVADLRKLLEDERSRVARLTAERDALAVEARAIAVRLEAAGSASVADLVAERDALRAQVERLTSVQANARTLLYEVIGQQHVLRATLDFVGKWGDDPVFVAPEQRKREVARSTEAIEEWHRRMVVVAQALREQP